MYLPDYTVSNAWQSYIHNQRENLKISFDCRISSSSATMSLQWHINNTHAPLPREPSQRDKAAHTTAIFTATADKYQISHIKKQCNCRQGSFLHVYYLSFEANNLSSICVAFSNWLRWIGWMDE